jgi:ATP-dependent DNA ligase
VIDGEALIWTGDRLDFNSLRQRMVTGRKALPAVVRERPASFAVFDVLAVAGHDTRDLALKDRRTLLEEMAAGWAHR